MPINILIKLVFIIYKEIYINSGSLEVKFSSYFKLELMNQ